MLLGSRGVGRPGKDQERHDVLPVTEPMTAIAEMMERLPGWLVDGWEQRSIIRKIASSLLILAILGVAAFDTISRRIMAAAS